MTNHPVEVQIGGRLYRLRGDDPALLARLAARVDATLREIAGPSGAAEDYKVAVLAALNLAATAEEVEQDRARTAERTVEASSRIEQRLTDLRDRLTAAADAV